MDWNRVIAVLRQKAAETQDMANASKQNSQKQLSYDIAAMTLRNIAEALAAGNR